MSHSVGIGVITYNRCDLLERTIQQIRAFTSQSDAVLIVADDGSTDGTRAMLDRAGVPVITGANRGIAWNKNRALFFLAHRLHCRAVILLEDDTHPTATGWEQLWIQAAQRFGHANHAPPWFDRNVVSGHFTLDSPAQCNAVTAQCSVYSADAVAYGGYFDTRFRRFGHEHVEHSRRLVRLGYGGIEHRLPGGGIDATFTMLRGDLAMLPSRSHAPEDGADDNADLARALIADRSHRPPWQTDEEMRIFRQEIQEAAQGDPRRFLVRPPISPFGQAGSRIGVGIPLPLPGRPI